ncbi:response regulator [Lyngbya confervoides]|uniref:Response regulator n=1 Tax=Lyngbya confervoides BDU141951 TaxID=1574623 RepID=A0ABD4T5U3_9CYAN|nr:response regulator [Lyngbya confervoides]MCM1983850.1 response regulator [Lyngbya confervoides BDU141951]
MIRILLADDSITVRQKLQYMLEPEADFEIIGTADSGEKTVELAGSLAPDVALVDIEMPNVDGLTATKQISQRYPDVKVLILSSYGDEAYIQQALKAGARGYLLKNTPAAELFHAIRFVQKGYLQLGPGLFEKYAHSDAESQQAQGLTDREDLSSNPADPSQGQDLPVSTTVLTPVPASLPAKQETTAIQPLPRAEATPVHVEAFDRPVVLRQSPVWSRAIVWLIISVATLTTAWAFIFKIEEAVPAQGQLEPRGAVKEVQVPVGGVVQKVMVEDGDSVKEGQVLATLDPQAAQSELKASQKIRRDLLQENEFYRRQLKGESGGDVSVEIPAKFISLTKNRQALVQENVLYRAQISGTTNLSQFSPEQRSRIIASRTRESSSSQAAQLQVAQLLERKAQNGSRLQQIKTQQQQNLTRQQAQEIGIESSNKTLTFERATLVDITDAYEKGAIAGLQFKRQQDQVQVAQATYDRAVKELNELKQEYQRLIQEENQIRREGDEIQKQIEQAQAQVDNTDSTNQEDLLTRIAENQKQIDEIDSQLTKAIVENEKQIAEIDNRLNQARLTLQYQEIRSPVDGVVFDLKASNNFVANTSEPIMKVVPSEDLEAKLYVTNRDIGFLQNNYLLKQAKDQPLPVDIRIDSFPYSEYGDVKGEIVWIGSDALPPTETRPYPSFPVRVKLDNQRLQVRKSEEKLALQSGMAISASIKVRDRPIISLITERFTQQIEKLKFLRN